MGFPSMHVHSSKGKRHGTNFTGMRRGKTLLRTIIFCEHKRNTSETTLSRICVLIAILICLLIFSQVYWAGPMSACLLAAFLHCLFFKQRERCRQAARVEDDQEEAIMP